LAGIADVEQMRAAVLSSRFQEHLSEIATVAGVSRGVVSAGHHYSCVGVDDDDFVGQGPAGEKRGATERKAKMRIRSTGNPSNNTNPTLSLKVWRIPLDAMLMAFTFTPRAARLDGLAAPTTAEPFSRSRRTDK
jgi:hypothetical protein